MMVATRLFMRAPDMIGDAKSYRPVTESSSGGFFGETRNKGAGLFGRRAVIAIQPVAFAMLRLGVALDLADAAVAIGLDDTGGARPESGRTQDVFLVRQVTRDVILVEDRIFKQRMFAPCDRNKRCNHRHDTRRLSEHLGFLFHGYPKAYYRETALTGRKRAHRRSVDHG